MRDDLRSGRQKTVVISLVSDYSRFLHMEPPLIPQTEIRKTTEIILQILNSHNNRQLTGEINVSSRPFSKVMCSARSSCNLPVNLLSDYSEKQQKKSIGLPSKIPSNTSAKVSRRNQNHSPESSDNFLGVAETETSNDMKNRPHDRPTVRWCDSGSSLYENKEYCSHRDNSRTALNEKRRNLHRGKAKRASHLAVPMAPKITAVSTTLGIQAESQKSAVRPILRAANNKPEHSKGDAAKEPDAALTDPGCPNSPAAAPAAAAAAAAAAMAAPALTQTDSARPPRRLWSRLLACWRRGSDAGPVPA